MADHIPANPTRPSKFDGWIPSMAPDALGTSLVACVPCWEGSGRVKDLISGLESVGVPTWVDDDYPTSTETLGLSINDVILNLGSANTLAVFAKATGGSSSPGCGHSPVTTGALDTRMRYYRTSANDGRWSVSGGTKLGTFVGDGASHEEWTVWIFERNGDVINIYRNGSTLYASSSGHGTGSYGGDVSQTLHIWDRPVSSGTTSSLFAVKSFALWNRVLTSGEKDAFASDPWLLVRVPLSATVDGDVAVSGATKDLGGIISGSTIEIPIVLTNGSGSTLVLDSDGASITGDGTLTTNPVSSGELSLANGESATFVVTLDSSGTATDRTVSISVANDAGDDWEQTLSFAVAGSGPTISTVQVLDNSYSGNIVSGTVDSITLSGDASSIDDFYVGGYVLADLGQNSFITAYNGTTKEATCLGFHTAPANASAVTITSGNMIQLLFDRPVDYQSGHYLDVTAPNLFGETSRRRIHAEYLRGNGTDTLVFVLPTKRPVHTGELVKIDVPHDLVRASNVRNSAAIDVAMTNNATLTGLPSCRHAFFVPRERVAKGVVVAEANASTNTDHIASVSCQFTDASSTVIPGTSVTARSESAYDGWNLYRPTVDLTSAATGLGTLRVTATTTDGREQHDDVLLAVGVTPTEYSVSVTGNDGTADGTAGLPFRDIGAALRHAENAGIKHITISLDSAGSWALEDSGVGTAFSFDSVVIKRGDGLTVGDVKIQDNANESGIRSSDITIPPTFYGIVLDLQSKSEPLENVQCYSSSFIDCVIEGASELAQTNGIGQAWISSTSEVWCRGSKHTKILTAFSKGTRLVRNHDALRVNGDVLQNVAYGCVTNLRSKRGAGTPGITVTGPVGATFERTGTVITQDGFWTIREGDTVIASYDVEDPLYDTIGKIADAINTVGGGWSATAHYPSMESTNSYEFGPLDCSTPLEIKVVSGAHTDLMQWYTRCNNFIYDGIFSEMAIDPGEGGYAQQLTFNGDSLDCEIRDSAILNIAERQWWDADGTALPVLRATIYNTWINTTFAFVTAPHTKLHFRDKKDGYGSANFKPANFVFCGNFMYAFFEEGSSFETPPFWMQNTASWYPSTYVGENHLNGVNPNVALKDYANNDLSPAVGSVLLAQVPDGMGVTSLGTLRPSGSPTAIGGYAGIEIDTTKPTVVGPSGTATTLTVPFSENVNGSGTGFTVTASGGAVSLGSVSGDDDTSERQFPYGRTIYNNETLTLAATSSNIQDSAGNFLEDFSGMAIANYSTTPPPDLVAPTVSTVSIGADGTTVTMTGPEPFVAGDDLWSGHTIAGKPLTYVSGSGTTTLTFSVAKIYKDVVVTNNYVQPGDGIKDAAGNLLESYATKAVTNGSMQDSPATGAIILYADRPQFGVRLDNSLKAVLYVPDGEGGYTWPDADPVAENCRLYLNGVIDVGAYGTRGEIGITRQTDVVGGYNITLTAGNQAVIGDVVRMMVPFAVDGTNYEAMYLVQWQTNNPLAENTPGVLSTESYLYACQYLRTLGLSAYNDIKAAVDDTETATKAAQAATSSATAAAEAEAAKNAANSAATNAQAAATATTKTALRESIGGRWKDETGKFFDLEIEDVP